MNRSRRIAVSWVVMGFALRRKGGNGGARKGSERGKRRHGKNRGLGYGALMASERCISCTTFNILAPIYKRLDKEVGRRRWPVLDSLVDYCHAFFAIFQCPFALMRKRWLL